MTYLLRDYDNLHDAMGLLWSLVTVTTDDDVHRQLLSAITYLREQAYDALPWAADVLPNKGWDGRRV